MAPGKAMKAMNVMKAMKKAAKAIKNAQGNNDAASPMKNAKKVKKAKKSKKADSGMGFEVLLTVCCECREAVEIVGCLAEFELMTLREYYCRQGCTTCLELHAVLIKWELNLTKGLNLTKFSPTNVAFIY